MPIITLPAGASRSMHETLVVAAVAANAALRNTLLHNPTAALQEMIGKKPPTGVKIVVVEETPDDLYILHRFERSIEPYEPATGPAHLLRSAIHVASMEDLAFKARLDVDPKGTLAREMGLRLGPNVKVHIMQEGPSIAYLILPHAPHLQGWRPPAAVAVRIAVKH
jgi:hypothetical protein